jgi:hypothetical protein
MGEMTGIGTKILYFYNNRPFLDRFIMLLAGFDNGPFWKGFYNRKNIMLILELG